MQIEGLHVNKMVRRRKEITKFAQPKNKRCAFLAVSVRLQPRRWAALCWPDLRDRRFTAARPWLCTVFTHVSKAYTVLFLLPRAQCSERAAAGGGQVPRPEGGACCPPATSIPTGRSRGASPKGAFPRQGYCMSTGVLEGIFAFWPVISGPPSRQPHLPS